MEFINDPNLEHILFKDAVRINYFQDMPNQIINDYGYSYIMIYYGLIETWNYKEEQIPIPKIFIKCTGDYFNVKAYENSSWLTFEMPNYVFHNITGKEASTCRNTLIDFKDFITNEEYTGLYNDLKDRDTIAGMIQIMDKHFSHYYKKWSEPLKSEEIVQFIYQSKGLIEKTDLIEKYGINAKSLDRLFNKEVGATPHRFIKLVRFNFVLRLIEERQDKSVLELIQEFDYFDQSHFEKDFKTFMGQSIYTYKNEFNPLLSNALARAFVK